MFYGASVKTESSVTGNVWRLGGGLAEEWGGDVSTADAFGDLAASSGLKIVRFPNGEVVSADVTCKVKVSSSNPLVASIDANVRKVRMYGLAL